MVEIWFAILCLVLAIFVVLDGWNFGAGALHLVVAKTSVERREVVSAIGPIWSWNEVWLVSAGGVLFLAFPNALASGLSGFYLAIYLVLWVLVLRGVSIEVGGHIDDGLWQGFWDVALAVSNILLAILFGAALGNVLRGVPVDTKGNFSLPLFTDFGVRGQLGILDWYTVSVAVFTLATLAAHGATYLSLKTQGAVHERSERLVRFLWPVVFVLLIVLSVETSYVRPGFFNSMFHRLFGWTGMFLVLLSGMAMIHGILRQREFQAFLASCLFITGLLIGAASSVFPVILFSTLDPNYSITAYNGGGTAYGLRAALFWWPIAFVLAFVYFGFVVRNYVGKVKPATDTKGYY